MGVNGNRGLTRLNSKDAPGPAAGDNPRTGGSLANASTPRALAAENGAAVVSVFASKMWYPTPLRRAAGTADVGGARE